MITIAIFLKIFNEFVMFYLDWTFIFKYKLHSTVVLRFELYMKIKL